MVTGGYDWTLKMDSTELYEPASGLWRIIEAKLPSPTDGLKATTVDNRVLIMGGRDDDNNSLDAILEFDMETETFSELGHMQEARDAHAVSVVNTEQYLEWCI